LGVLLILAGISIVTGWMTEWEALALEFMPHWLIAFVSRF
jgi:uncharacterized membrane protein